MPNASPNPSGRNQSDHDLLERIVAEQRRPLTRYAARLLGDPDRAQDVVQDTFVRFLARPPEEQGSHSVEWLFSVCRNRAIDVLRKENRSVPLSEEAQHRIDAAAPHPSRGLEEKETQETLLLLINRLPPNQQEVVRLKFQNGFDYKEIARITELSVSNVGFLIHTAVQRLRREWPAAQDSLSR